MKSNPGQPGLQSNSRQGLEIKTSAADFQREELQMGTVASLRKSNLMRGKEK
jgi:hypothetical protein